MKSMATSSSVAHSRRPGRIDLMSHDEAMRSQEAEHILHSLKIHMCVCACVLPLVKAQNISDIPENNFFLVEDVNRNMTTGVQIMELMRDVSLHFLYKLLLSINQALNQLTKDKIANTHMFRSHNN